MAETSQFALPLLAGSQSQKHVTVNEALAVLDSVAQLRVLDTVLVTPPGAANNGDAYLVPVGAGGEWFGYDGQVAIAVNGGWRALTPKPGWQCFNVSSGTHLLYDGTEWLDSTLAATATGAATSFLISELDVTLSAGPDYTTDTIIPSHSLVFGVTARVLSPITGAATAWRLGDANGDDRFATGLGLDQGSFALGMSNPPTVYYEDTSVVLTGEGGDFAGGVVRVAAHYMRLTPPRA